MISKDIPEKEFLNISARVPLINVDLFIVNEKGEVLLAWRNDEYCGTGWHIPGGIIRHGETMQERLKRTAESELRFIPRFDECPCKITEIFLEQRYRNHFISLLFRGECKKIEIKTKRKFVDYNVGDLCWFDHFPGLVYSQTAYEEFLKGYFLTKANHY